jgi:dTDP-4-amino-4,6-dideoxygalactose transaminase
MTWRIPLSDVDFGPEELQAVAEVLRSGWLSMGSVTQQFEQEFALYTNSSYAIAVTNATAALHLACIVLGLGPDDEVIVPSLTFVASVNAIRYTGATPVFADIEGEHFLNITPDTIRACLTEKTRAIMVVHYAGYACDMPAIQALAKENSLAVIEDAAHAVGSTLDGRMLGTWGDIGCYSFFSNKNMTTGEGGMLVTDNEIYSNRLRVMRSHGMTSLSWDRHQGHAWSYDVVELGYNYRIDEMRAALGRVQLAKLERSNHRRKELTKLYREFMDELAPDVIIPFDQAPGDSSCHILPLLLPKGTDRIQFMERMKGSGIQTSIHYPPVHQFRIYQDQKHSPVSLRTTEEIVEREVTLPLYPGMSNEDVKTVVEAVRESLR